VGEMTTWSLSHPATNCSVEENADTEATARTVTKVIEEDDCSIM
jgi:hypothetical protein